MSLASRGLVQFDEHVHYVDGVQQGVSHERGWHAEGAVGGQWSDHAIFGIVDSRGRLYHDHKCRDRGGGGNIRLTIL